MKILPTLIFALCATATITAAHAAATKCVALNKDMSCSTGVTSQLNKADWEATCTYSTLGISTSIKGVAFCSNQTGDIGGTASSLSASSTATDNKYCWCKMVSPAVSKWVFRSTHDTVNNCGTFCSHYCSGFLQSNVTYRTAMFSNMTD